MRHAAWDQRTGATAPKPFPEISDLITSFYPYHALVGRAVAQRVLPLWNPSILGGAPLAAHSQAATFYPFNLPYLFLPLHVAWTVCVMLRWFLAAIFMAILLRSIGASTSGSIFSGIVFSLCGFMTAWQGQSMGDAAVWLPIICFAVLRLSRHPTPRSIALASLCLAMPVLAGHPETAVHLTLVALALAAYLFWLEPKKHFAIGFICAGVLAIGLAAIQIVPTLEWLKQLGHFTERIPPVLSFHDGQGFFSRDIFASPNSNLIRIPEGASYFGMLALLAAPLAWFHRSRCLAVFFTSLAAMAAAIAFGIPPFHWIVNHVPILQSMKNGRLILVVTFGVAILAGLGVSALEREEDGHSKRLRVAATSMVAVMFLFAVGGIYEVHRATWVPVRFLRGPWGSLLFLIPSTIVLLLRIQGRLRGRLFSFSICGLAAVELITFASGYTGFTAPADVFPPAPVFDFLKKQGNPSTFRIAKAGYPIPANSGIIYGLESADGYEIPNERARQFSAGLIEERDDAVFYEAEKVAASPDRRLDMLNVKFWIVIAGSRQFREFGARPERFKLAYEEGSIAIFENKRVLPRLFAVPQAGVEISPYAIDQLTLIRSSQFDPEKTVYVSKRPTAMKTSPAPDASFTSNIRFVQSDMISFEFRSHTSGPSILVLSQIYYPGWKAAIDGKEVPVEEVDFALMGVAAPMGEHTIKFFFEPSSFWTGTILSSIALLVLVACATPAGVWKKTRFQS